MQAAWHQELVQCRATAADVEPDEALSIYLATAPPHHGRADLAARLTALSFDHQVLGSNAQLASGRNQQSSSHRQEMRIGPLPLVRV